VANQYEKKYDQPAFYWGKKPSPLCLKVLEHMPVDRPLRLIDIGCGEGRNAVFFARNGFEVTALDLAASGVAKTKQLAGEAGVRVEAFEADMLTYRLSEPFDVIFCHGCLQYIPPDMRPSLLGNYRQCTNPGGLNVLSVFVKKPFIAKAPDGEATAHRWISGELFTHYTDWRLEYCTEYIFDCMSSGVPHQHAMDQVIARNVC
jgi:tellurite methyltransferase